MKSPLPKEAYTKNAEVYKVLANAKRLEILNLLKLREFASQELRSLLRLSKANLSQHLGLLRRSKLVLVRRSGKNAYYRIIDPRIVEPCSILHQMRQRNKLEHVY